MEIESLLRQARRQNGIPTVTIWIIANAILILKGEIYMGLFKKKVQNNILPNYKKLTENLYISQTEKKIIINNNSFNFWDILDVKLVEKDGEIYAQNDALSIKLNAGDCGALTSNGYIGKEVVLGIRPEDIHIEDIFVDNSLDSTFEANVELGELMGAEIYAYLKAANHNITARFDGRYKLNIGDKLKE